MKDLQGQTVTRHGMSAKASQQGPAPGHQLSSDAGNYFLMLAKTILSTSFQAGSD
jgi:hypothetical protein